MRETRIRVDKLLAQGRIEEAEAYMEERRQEFVAHGYYIRKLNQAYFAFHGAYADTSLVRRGRIPPDRRYGSCAPAALTCTHSWPG